MRFSSTVILSTLKGAVVKAARIVEEQKPLRIAEVDTPQAVGAEVVVKVVSAGVCHSDLHLWEGGYDMGDGQFLNVTDRGVRYPVTPGHEIAGTVSEIGPAVPNLKKGDPVLVYPWLGCGSCKTCLAGNENLCESPRSIGLFQDGGYAQYVKVPHHKYLADITGLDPDGATSLACAGLTAFTAVKKANVTLPEFIVIIGAGGLGLMGVQIAKAITSAKVICVDLDDAKLQVAAEMGADYTVNSKGGDGDSGSPGAASMIVELCGGRGADSVIDFVNAPNTAGLGLSVLRKSGNMVLVGLFGGSLAVPLVTVPLKALTIQGAYTGSYSDMVELIGLARRGAINPKITKKYSLVDANAAMEDLRARRISGRAVIRP